MSRLRRIEDRDRIFFVTTNLAAHVPVLSAGERDGILQQLARQHDQQDFLLFGYVIMPSHLHLLLVPEQRGLMAAMHQLKRVTAEKLVRQRQSRGPVWQARYFDSILRRAGDFGKKLEYIHNNPVEARLVQRREDWPWSSAAHYEHTGTAPVSVDAVNLPTDREAWLYPAPWRRP
jgi:putative transposase